ncbi:MAG: ATPase [Chloroflexi bacterium RBG_13_68_17]|nr:MAG: ATPase [Chloroflexi bacterium RBG_13_68_17]
MTSGQEPLPREDPWHAREPDDVFETLATSPKDGLSQREAEARLARVGPNELREAPRPTFWHMLLEQFNNFIVIILIVASILSAVLGDYIEAAAILAIVVLNALLGVIQERRAEEALAALRRMAAPEAQVIRDGHRQLIPGRQLVPGDLVLLEAGNYVPADMRLIESANLRVEEAALTGESVPVEKDARVTLRQDVPLGDRRNTAFMGTLVNYGRGKGVVISTGMHTQIGMIATMLQLIQEEPTPLQQRLDRLGKTLGMAALVVCALVFLVGWVRGYPPLDMFLVAVSLAVAAVPEGLPAVVTITLALGMREMIKRHALIRRLSSVETLGSATVICSDKTGTLTQNQMTATRLWVDGMDFEISGRGYAPHGQFHLNGQPVDLREYPAGLTALWVAVLANDASLEPSEKESSGYQLAGDPTEGALIVAAAKAGASRDAFHLAYPRIDEVPFDSARKRMTTVHKIRDPRPEDFSPFYDATVQDWEVAATKGAPDVVLELCTQYQRIHDKPAPLDDEARRRIMQANDHMTRQALRVLAVAYRADPDVPDQTAPESIERDLVFVGLIGMIDPARPEVLPAMDKARRAGIRTIMITGDYPETARAIAEDIGLLQPGHKVMAGTELARLDDPALRAAVAHTDVFARVSPEHKVRIVDALKHNGQVVAMTGDGVNDAPALKRADIGVAMGITGTDVAKETADMVLTDDNYVSIVAAVEQGRIIYSNIRKFVFYLLSCNVAEILIIFLAIMAGLPSPLTAIQLLLLNLVTDGLPALALGYEKGDPDTMDRPPRPPSEPIINRWMRTGIVVQTVAITGVTLGAYFVGLRAHPQAPEFAETMAFVTLSFSELLRAFTARSEHYPLLKIGLLTNRRMFYAVIGSLVLLVAVVYMPPLQRVFDTVPLGPAQWELVLPLLFVPAVAAELTKWIGGRRAAPAA